MTYEIATPTGTAAKPATLSTRNLLTAGIIVGPLLLGVALIQDAFRDDFTISKRPMSELSLGSFGFVQIGNFIVSGLLVIAFAVGLRRVLHPGRAGTFGPWLIGLFGLGLISAGCFIVDYVPPGTTDETPSWHAWAHAMSTMLAFISTAIATFVFARRFIKERQFAWFFYSLFSGLAPFFIILSPSPLSGGIRFFLATLVACGWVALLALRLRRDHEQQPA